MSLVGVVVSGILLGWFGARIVYLDGLHESHNILNFALNGVAVIFSSLALYFSAFKNAWYLRLLVNKKS